MKGVEAKDGHLDISRFEPVTSFLESHRAYRAQRSLDEPFRHRLRIADKERV
jgi:hypothetical protein